jgi:hypothetical protein
VWQNFSSPAVIFATYSKEHTISINENGYWIIDGEETDKKAVGKDGNSVAVKGRVDVYSDNDKGGDSTLTSLESYPISLDPAPETGDCWIVKSGEDADEQDISGHLFLYIGGAHEGWEDDWQDLGEFKGEKGDDGASAYLYLAWATNVEFNDDAEQTFKKADNFTKDPLEGQSYPWMGIKVSGTELTEQQLTPDIFKWNYLAGRDGTDYEYVYIRTSVEIAPEISSLAVNEQGYQDAEFKPDVDNTDDYVTTGNDRNIAGTQFTDDPMGISERWPYEWQSKRERINGVWGAFQSPAVLHRNWAASGSNGTDAMWVKVSQSMFAINADSSGRVAQQQSLTLSCWLRTSAALKTISDITVNYGDDTLPNLLPGMTGQGFRLLNDDNTYNAKAVITVILPAKTVLETKDIDITLNGIAKATVPVVIVRKGETGSRGTQGASLRFRGVFDPDDSNVSYIWDENFRDCVKYDGVYWIVGSYGGVLRNVDVPGNGSGNPWVNMGNAQFVATDLLLAERATIPNLISDNVRTAVSGPRVELHDSTAEFYGRLANPSIKLTVDNDGVGCLTFYDKDGNPVIEAGPRGIAWIQSVIQERFSSAYYVKMQNDSAYDRSESTSGQVQLHQFTARQVNGVIMGDTTYTNNDSQIAADANGKYFTATSIVSSGSLDKTKLVNGLYRSADAAIRRLSNVSKDGVDGIKNELLGYGLTQEQVSQFNWSLNNDGVPSLATPISMQTYYMFSGGVASMRLVIWQGSTQFIID